MATQQRSVLPLQRPLHPLQLDWPTSTNHNPQIRTDRDNNQQLAGIQASKSIHPSEPRTKPTKTSPCQFPSPCQLHRAKMGNGSPESITISISRIGFEFVASLPAAGTSEASAWKLIPEALARKQHRREMSITISQWPNWHNWQRRQFQFTHNERQSVSIDYERSTDL